MDVLFYYWDFFMICCFLLYIYILMLFIILILFVGGVIGWLGYGVVSSILKILVNEMNVCIGKDVESVFMMLIGLVEMVICLFSYSGIMVVSMFEEWLVDFGLMCEVLQDFEVFIGLYVGYGNGDFFLLCCLQNVVDWQFFKVFEQVVYLVQSIDCYVGQVCGCYVFFDVDLKILKVEEQVDYLMDYDLCSCGWYQLVLVVGGQIKMLFYVFFSICEVGMIIVSCVSCGEVVVVGVDIWLVMFNQMLVG